MRERGPLCGEHSGKDNKDIIDHCINKDIGACNREFKRLFPKYSVSMRTALSFLMRLEFRSILTLNFDPYIQLNSIQKHYDIVHIYPDLPMHNGVHRNIYYIHGCFNESSSSSSVKDLVFGRDSFDRAYNSGLLPGLLLQVLTYNNILFIGANPCEDNLSKLLRDSRDLRGIIGHKRSISNRRFCLWPKPDGSGPIFAEQMGMIESIRSLDIEPVLYDKIDSTHKGLEVLLDSWVQDGRRSMRSAPFAIDNV